MADREVERPLGGPNSAKAGQTMSSESVEFPACGNRCGSDKRSGKPTLCPICWAPRMWADTSPVLTDPDSPTWRWEALRRPPCPGGPFPASLQWLAWREGGGSLVTCFAPIGAWLRDNPEPMAVQLIHVAPSGQFQSARNGLNKRSHGGMGDAMVPVGDTQLATRRVHVVDGEVDVLGVAAREDGIVITAGGIPRFVPLSPELSRLGVPVVDWPVGDEAGRKTASESVPAPKEPQCRRPQGVDSERSRSRQPTRNVFSTGTKRSSQPRRAKAIPLSAQAMTRFVAWMRAQTRQSVHTRRGAPGHAGCWQSAAVSQSPLLCAAPVLPPVGLQGLAYGASKPFGWTHPCFSCRLADPLQGSGREAETVRFWKVGFFQRSGSLEVAAMRTSKRSGRSALPPISAPPSASFPEARPAILGQGPRSSNLPTSGERHLPRCTAAAGSLRRPRRWLRESVRPGSLALPRTAGCDPPSQRKVNEAPRCRVTHASGRPRREDLK